MTSHPQSLIGHASHAQLFATLVERQRLPVAVLLTGPSMVGKTTLAEQIIRRAICNTRNACGTCTNCRLSLEAHPDVLRYGGDAEGENRDRVAEIVRRMVERPVQAAVLIVLLERVDRYSPAAHALLLKAIEDAPQTVRVFLTAAQQDRVPATVRSRALVRTLAPLTTDDLAAGLRARGIGEAESRELAERSGGRPGLAFRLREDADLNATLQARSDFFKRLPTMTIAERSVFTETIEDDQEAEELLTTFQETLRQQLRNVADGAATTPNLRTLLRRSREGLAMIAARVPPRLAVEYVFFSSSPT